MTAAKRVYSTWQFNDNRRSMETQRYIGIDLHRNRSRVACGWKTDGII